LQQRTEEKEKGSAQPLPSPTETEP
jgi:hypothetical protein